MQEQSASKKLKLQNTPLTNAQKLFQEREALIIKYMESFMGQEEDPYKTDNIPTVHYIKLQNGQMFRINVGYDEFSQLPSREKEAEERKVKRSDFDDESDDEHESLFATPEARKLYDKLNVENRDLDAKLASMTEEEKVENDRKCWEVLGEPEEES